MATVHKQKTSDYNPNNTLDALCHEFDGVSFYGLEYVVDDFFQSLALKKPPIAPPPSVDWFGLYD